MSIKIIEELSSFFDLVDHAQTVGKNSKEKRAKLKLQTLGPFFGLVEEELVFEDLFAHDGAVHTEHRKKIICVAEDINPTCVFLDAITSENKGCL